MGDRELHTTDVAIVGGGIAASLIGDSDLPEPVTELGLTEAMLAPRR